MKTYQTVLTALSLLVLSLSAASAESALQIAKAKDIPGKFVVGACDSFSRDLLSRFERAGVHAYYITFNWEKMDLQGRSGAHAMVVFKDEKGRFYGIDNLTWKPVWLKGETPREWVKFFSGMDLRTKVVSQVATSAVRGDTRLAIR